jgi:hypothetical protein
MDAPNAATSRLPTSEIRLHCREQFAFKKIELGVASPDLDGRSNYTQASSSCVRTAHS